MSDRRNTGDFYSAARIRILEALAKHGPLTIPELPRGWPITRAFVTVLAEQIVDSGLAEWRDAGHVPGKPALRITDAGRRWLEGGGEPVGPTRPGPGVPPRPHPTSLAAD